MDPLAEAACLIQPKEEVADDVGITYGCEDMEAVTVKEEWCDIRLELEGGVSEQDSGMREQDVNMVMPIKTELTLSDDLARLRTEHQRTEHGSVPQVLKVDWEPKAEADEVADCASTGVAPLSAKLATKHGNKVQAEEADTVQKSEQIVPVTKHTRTKSCQKYYSCKLCKYKSSHNYLLLSHMRTHTVETPYLICKLCGYRCSSNSVLVKHMRTHTGQKPYSCKLCDYRCAQKSNLVRHKITHTGEKPYVCELCDCKYASKSYLVSHMRMHTGEKPYACMLCNYRCACKSYLVSHMRAHTRKKLFRCDLCDYKCAWKGNLTKHMKSHTSEKCYVCYMCDYKNANKSNLMPH